MVPDSIEPMEGWKVLWYEEGILYSPQRGTPWPRNERLVAQCGNHLPHEAPGGGCRCGIYMVKEAVEAINYVHGRQPVALVKLKGWGKVFPASQGARVQYAYPVEIIPIQYVGTSSWSKRQMEEVREAYQVPVTPKSLAVALASSRKVERFEEQILMLRLQETATNNKQRRVKMGLMALLTATLGSANAAAAFLTNRPGFYVNAAVAAAATLLLLWAARKLRQAGL